MAQHLPAGSHSSPALTPAFHTPLCSSHVLSSHVSSHACSRLLFFRPRWARAPSRSWTSWRRRPCTSSGRGGRPSWQTSRGWWHRRFRCVGVRPHASVGRVGGWLLAEAPALRWGVGCWSLGGGMLLLSQASSLSCLACRPLHRADQVPPTSTFPPTSCLVSGVGAAGRGLPNTDRGRRERPAASDMHLTCTAAGHYYMY